MNTSVNFCELCVSVLKNYLTQRHKEHRISQRNLKP